MEKSYSDIPRIQRANIVVPRFVISKHARETLGSIFADGSSPPVGYMASKRLLCESTADLSSVDSVRRAMDQSRSRFTLSGGIELQKVRPNSQSTRIAMEVREQEEFDHFVRQINEVDVVDLYPQSEDEKHYLYVDVQNEKLRELYFQEEGVDAFHEAVEKSAQGVRFIGIHVVNKTVWLP